MCPSPILSKLTVTPPAWIVPQTPTHWAPFWVLLTAPLSPPVISLNICFSMDLMNRWLVQRGSQGIFRSETWESCSLIGPAHHMIIGEWMQLCTVVQGFSGGKSWGGSCGFGKLFIDKLFGKRMAPFLLHSLHGWGLDCLLVTIGFGSPGYPRRPMAASLLASDLIRAFELNHFERRLLKPNGIPWRSTDFMFFLIALNCLIGSCNSWDLESTDVSSANQLAAVWKASLNPQDRACLGPGMGSTV